MNAKEILSKLESVFVSDKSEDLPKDEVVQEELSEIAVEAEEVKEELAEDAKEEVKEAVESPEAEIKVEFATKEDLSSLKNEMLEILSKLEEIRSEYKKDVPQELSEVKEDLSEQPIEELVHSPESDVDTKASFNFSSNRIKTTQDRVFAKLFKK